LLLKLESLPPARNSRGCCLILLLTLLAGPASSLAQTGAESPYYARKNTFGVFTAYSNDSSHMLLGITENRKLLDFGVSYSRRLLLNRIVNWQYNAEFLPVALESDPLEQEVVNQISPTPVTQIFKDGLPVTCAPRTISYSSTDPVTGVTYSGTAVFSCYGRRWTIGEGISPAGLQWNFRPRHKVQPFFISHGGYMYSTQAIPVYGAGSFNFTFDLGAGVEVFRTQTRSVRAEYRYHHISNNSTATANPGIDSGLFQLTYSFGH
jgi:opacity protein-like surface antigen